VPLRRFHHETPIISRQCKHNLVTLWLFCSVSYKSCVSVFSSLHDIELEAIVCTCSCLHSWVQCIITYHIVQHAAAVDTAVKIGYRCIFVCCVYVGTRVSGSDVFTGVISPLLQPSLPPHYCATNISAARVSRKHANLSCNIKIATVWVYRAYCVNSHLILVWVLPALRDNRLCSPIVAPS